MEGQIIVRYIHSLWIIINNRIKIEFKSIITYIIVFIINPITLIVVLINLWIEDR